MQDIVDRLRQADQMQEGRGSGLYKEAADEIEGLRSALAEMRDLAGMPEIGLCIKDVTVVRE